MLRNPEEEKKGDLISRSALLEGMKTWYMEYIYLPCHFEELVKRQPTAYDVDKVVNQLNEKKSNLTEWAEDMAYKLAIEDAIKIVKSCE